MAAVDAEFVTSTLSPAPSDVSSDNDEEVVEIVDSNTDLIKALETGRFSDCSVLCFGKTYKLHRVLLVQSPLFKELLDTFEEFLCLDLDNLQISQHGLEELALRDMYEIHNRSCSRRCLITSSNVFEVLGAAAYLRLAELCNYCMDYIQRELAGLGSIVEFGKALITLKSISIHVRYLNRYYLKLHASYLGTIFYCLSLCQEELEPGFEMDWEKYYIPNHGTAVSKAAFLAQLPLIWIERVIKSDCLCVSQEFDRYLLVKEVIRLQKKPHNPTNPKLEISKENVVENVVDIGVVQESDQSSGEETVAGCSENSNDEFKEVIPNISNKIYNFIGGLLPISKKRKLDLTTDSTDDNLEQEPILTTAKRTIKPIKSNLMNYRVNEIPLPQNIFEKGVIYTYMSFPQLGVVKKDGLVPFNLALESYWLQAELGNSEEPHAILPPFRFSAKFENVSQHFSNENETMMGSESFKCAGVSYRVLLVREKKETGLKALLQRSRGKSPRISYSIYVFDHRSPLTPNILQGVNNPITHCTDDDNGYANYISPVSVKNEEGVRPDILHLVACIRFA